MRVRERRIIIPLVYTRYVKLSKFNCQVQILFYDIQWIVLRVKSCQVTYHVPHINVYGCLNEIT